MLTILGGKIPLDGASQTVAEGDLEFPFQEFPGQGVVGHPVQRPGRHVKAGDDFGLVAGHLQRAVSQVMLDVLQSAAVQIVHNPNLTLTRHL